MCELFLNLKVIVYPMLDEKLVIFNYAYVVNDFSPI